MNCVIVRSSFKCLVCHDVISSVHRHEFNWCSCGNIFVDGGLAYQRFGGQGFIDGTYQNLSVYEEVKDED